jgi:hypothetical protein
LYQPLSNNLSGLGAYDCDALPEVTARKDLNAAFSLFSSTENTTDGDFWANNDSLSLQTTTIQPFYMAPESMLRFKKTSYGPMEPGDLVSSTKLYFLAWDRTGWGPDEAAQLQTTALPIPRCIEPDEDMDPRLVSKSQLQIEL